LFNEIFKPNESRPAKFQVLFLRNDSSQEVEVQEMKEVDFLTVQQHLDNGESVFITSQDAQKLEIRDKRRPQRSLKSRLVTAFYFDPV
jgi:hypothetical protein